MFKNDPVRPDAYKGFEKPTPAWFEDAKLGIFVHWGPYSVPAWAEPIGALGTIDPEYWNIHNPYAEWYYNTVRIEGSPAHQHQQEVYGGASYEEFIDLWKAENFDADDVMALVASTGAQYFVPTTKHHDGVTLWDAPGTDGRNTVARGPHRDLVGEFRDAAEKAGVRFGVYYSGGLDWHFSDLPPITGKDDDIMVSRPVGEDYAKYAFDHVADLIEKYDPEVLWGDIEWPDAGKPDGPFSMAELFRRFYASRPEGVANDRWGETHWDFRTSEYEHGASSEQGTWENCRGVGFSFGHNQLEDESNSLDGAGALRHFLDVVSRGGNLLLNIGLTASGEVTPLQRRVLEELGAWNTAHADAVFGSRALPASVARPSGDSGSETWVRWTRTGDAAAGAVDGAGAVAAGGPAGVAHAFVDAPAGAVVALDVTPGALDVAGATSPDGATAALGADGGLTVTVPAGARRPGPVEVAFPLA